MQSLKLCIPSCYISVHPDYAVGSFNWVLKIEKKFTNLDLCDEEDNGQVHETRNLCI
jgi:hypothetical protein